MIYLSLQHPFMNLTVDCFHLRMYQICNTIEVKPSDYSNSKHIKIVKILIHNYNLEIYVS